MRVRAREEGWMDERAMKQEKEKRTTRKRRREKWIGPVGSFVADVD
jgi:hypothetical protein